MSNRETFLENLQRRQSHRVHKSAHQQQGLSAQQEKRVQSSRRLAINKHSSPTFLPSQPAQLTNPCLVSKQHRANSRLKNLPLLAPHDPLRGDPRLSSALRTRPTTLPPAPHTPPETQKLPLHPHHPHHTHSPPCITSEALHPPVTAETPLFHRHGLIYAGGKSLFTARLLINHDK